MSKYNIFKINWERFGKILSSKYADRPRQSINIDYEHYARVLQAKQDKIKNESNIKINF